MCIYIYMYISIYTHIHLVCCRVVLLAGSLLVCLHARLARGGLRNSYSDPHWLAVKILDDCTELLSRDSKQT